ncbi:hypothetical protein I4U23_018499 [Adineta vaga]|nr:hypothetical protein I4U23_018499 [Adineta vaga]
MSETDIGIIKQEVLSLLVSAKYGLSEHELLNDYRLFNSNKDLPYREFGYSSLVSLLRCWPDVCRIQQQGNSGSIKILAVEEESTKHILSMVKGQRQGKPRRRTQGGGNRGRGGGGSRGRNMNRDNHGARFSDNTFNFNNNNNRSRGNGRGTSYGRPAHNTRSDRSTISTRSAMGHSNQYTRNRGNASIPPRVVKQQQKQQQQSQTRSNISTFNQPAMSSFNSRQSTHLNGPDDRRVTNNTTSLRVTVSNNTNDNNHQSSPDTPYHLSENEIHDGEYPDEEEDDYKEEEVINNLQNLLAEYSHGVRLLSLDELYQKKYGKSLLIELKITNILLLQDFVDDFACVLRLGEENGSCDHIITLKDPKQVEQTQANLLQQITDSGIVPATFRYANNLYSYINDPRFQGFISDIDKNEHCLHVQPVRYQEHIETLMEELDSYYSSIQSNSLIIKNLEAGLACVTQYDDAYHRVFIKETDLYKCVIVYIDYGTTEEINKDDQQFKYLLNHFAELPCMALACRLDDVYFLPDDNRWSLETYNEVYALCKNGPFFIEPTGYLNGLLTIQILDSDNRSLNDILVELNFAVKISTIANNVVTNQHKHEHNNVPKPVQLSFEILDHAVQCPLPNSEPSTPEKTTANSAFQFPDNTTFAQSTNIKLIPIDANSTLYLIRYTNDRPFIPCFSLAQLLNASESDILSETLLSRTRLQLTDEYRSVFDFLRQKNPTNCLHISQNFIFLFDLISTMKFIEQLNIPNAENFIEVLRQQVSASNTPLFWTNANEYDKSRTPVSALSSNQSINKSDVERYNELLANRRNILCNMLRTDNLTECSLQLESIENELQTLIEKMRLGSSSSSSQQNTNISSSSSSTPSVFSTSVQTNQRHSMNNKSDKLKDLMERCKKLINIILILNDHVDIDDDITSYIQNNLSFLSSQKTSSQDEQLHKHYSDLLQNLTLIVNDLQQKLPFPIDSLS